MDDIIEINGYSFKKRGGEFLLCISCPQKEREEHTYEVIDEFFISLGINRSIFKKLFNAGLGIFPTYKPPKSESVIEYLKGLSNNTSYEVY